MWNVDYSDALSGTAEIPLRLASCSAPNIPTNTLSVRTQNHQSTTFPMRYTCSLSLVFVVQKDIPERRNGQLMGPVA